MVIFNSYVNLPEGKTWANLPQSEFFYGDIPSGDDFWSNCWVTDYGLWMGLRQKSKSLLLDILGRSNMDKSNSKYPTVKSQYWTGSWNIKYGKIQVR